MLRAFRSLVPAVLSRPLNDVQEQLVIASPSDSLFIVAGPGSGKTTVLALRVLKLALVDRVEPTTIVATTFTRKAAKELRSRILGWGDLLRERLLAAHISPDERVRVAQLDFNAVVTGTLDSIAETILGQFRAPGAQPPAVIEEFVAHAVMLRHGLFAAYTGEAEHSDRPIVNAPIGDRDRSGATLAGRSAVELALLSP